MPQASNLVGSATRYVSGRNGLQTVYWIRASSGGQQKFLKLSKVCNFGKAATPPQKIKEMQKQVTYYD